MLTEATTALWIWIFLLVIPAIYLLRLWTKVYRIGKHINRLPGPKIYPILGTLPEIFGIPREEIFSFMLKRGDKHGPISRTWNIFLPEVHLAKPEYFEIIMTNIKQTEKSYIYDFMRPWLGDGLLNSNGTKWHKRRKMITPTFHFSILESFVEVFEEKSRILTDLLKEKCDGDAFDIYPYITRCALDIICETAMGTAANAQENTNSKYVTSVYKMSEIIFQQVMKPWLRITKYLKITPYAKLYNETLDNLHAFTLKVIRERQNLRLQNGGEGKKNIQNDDESVFGRKRRKAFLDLLLDASEGGEMLTEQDLSEEVDTFMFEGHDTTTSGICWTLFLLGNYPDVQDAVAKELEELFEGSDRPTTMRDLQQMKYLEMVIKESLRLYPSVPLIGRKLAEDVQIDGYTIPAGCDVLLNIYRVHRDPEVWGPDPEKFDPDNFLPERVQGRHPFAYVPFSGGQRNCIGQKFALLEEKAVISSILRRYKIESQVKKSDIRLIGELVLRPQNGIQIKLKSR